MIEDYQKWQVDTNHLEEEAQADQRKDRNKSYEVGTGHQGLILVGEEEDKLKNTFNHKYQINVNVEANPNEQ